MELAIIVNGKKHKLVIEEHALLIDVLREQLQLTGSKVCCGQGSCGACTVLANDVPVQSCITLAARYHGAAITTIEGLATNGELHALQRRFAEKGAVQCGFCTSGMIMTSLAFVNDNPTPEKEEIRQALSGNLCRCTGYQKIVEAVYEYAHGIDVLPDDKQKFAKVGRSQAYIEATRKTLGTADYADDIRMKGSLYCSYVRSPLPHARINKINVEAAMGMDGVRAVVTGDELPIPFGVLPLSENETAMAIGKTRYVGEIVAAVAADTKAMAEAACKAIDVDYTPIRAFLEMDDSLEDAGEYETIHPNGKFNNNIHKKAELRFGDQQQGLEASAVRSRMDFNFAGVSHGFTEPHAATAYWDENGLTIITATQVPHYLHRALAKVFELPMSRIRVIKPYLGGGFGGKSDPFPHEMIVSLLARKTGKPIRTRLTREEVFISNHGRHPTRLNMELGLDDHGKFTALDADIVIDGGAYGSFGVVTSYYNGVLLQAPYAIENFGFRTRRVYTNKPQCGAMRGHGAVNSRFAVETLIDDLARQTEQDPCELRLKNFIDSNVLTVGQYRITSNGSRESLEKVMEQSGWKEKFNKLPFGRGIGVACGFFISGSALPIHWNKYPQSVVHLKVDMDGRVLVTSGASDIGQGSDTMLAIIVAEVLGLSMDRVFVLAADTLLTPVDLGSYSSRVTFMAGNAAKMAAENLRGQISSAVKKSLAVEDGQLIFSEETVFTTDKKINLTWLEAVELGTNSVGALNSSGYYNSPKLGGDFKGAGAGLSPSYSFGAVVAEISVDLNTGRIALEEIWGAHDCGKAINPLAVEGQLEGSWHMGIGQALSEELRYHEGLLVNGNFLDYKIPTALDTPEMKANIIETNDPEGPFGAKECGEGAIHPVIPAVGNAVFDAIKVRVTSLPMTPEKILGLMERNKLEKNSTK